MERLNNILHELGISKVKLAKYLGVSRQMIYNYLELDDINKWPKDKKVLLLNLLGIKTPEELDNIKVDTDYILEVESRINSLFETTSNINYEEAAGLLNGLDKKQKELLYDVVQLMREKLEDGSDSEGYTIIKYIYHLLQSVDSSKEIKYMLGYIAKATGFVKPLDFAFNEDEQFVFESIMFSGMVLYNSGNYSKSRIAESHKRFVNQIENRIEEKLGRTRELIMIKEQALKELGMSKFEDENAAIVLEKMAEIQSRKVN